MTNPYYTRLCGYDHRWQFCPESTQVIGGLSRQYQQYPVIGGPLFIALIDQIVWPLRANRNIFRSRR